MTKEWPIKYVLKSMMHDKPMPPSELAMVEVAALDEERNRARNLMFVINSALKILENIDGMDNGKEIEQTINLLKRATAPEAGAKND